ncbi:nucleotide-binding universal stress UspA family protein [Thermosporothrix hazakensis]|jgi:nucleotide-binding universal stress UspA family protein|uniref:Nucleotide-binding universal stress UspA family protein n=2 Tax=Thermosporothrix TaxID=768650 RepID=A0A326UWP9_THEHA|nr:universal stress protein [Thermosporothrix hazakensis]PZW36763.1 nucleotide-binding universal stress UspA family protein [Thermosporothrix hazakensis]BBH89230.1 hypothetical protein KTC_39810 [Thermosporothrix sp. COM3]GCE47413.1 hypothetical protein KTH_22820 [Thermosporothrix hazakensis]
MNKSILLGIDSELSPTAQYALQAVSEFVERAAPQVRLLLLNVIPVTQVIPAQPGMYVGQVLPGVVTPAQRTLAEETLQKARLLLEQRGIGLERTESIIREGVPADEIVRAAREHNASFIVVGRHADTLKHRLRRMLVGSVSQRVLQLASCPVMVVVTPEPDRVDDLVGWYKEEVKRYLKENNASLTILTPQKVVQFFTPPGKDASGKKELDAATKALEQLTEGGMLCRHQVEGELRYVND